MIDGGAGFMKNLLQHGAGMANEVTVQVKVDV